MKARRWGKWVISVGVIGIVAILLFTKMSTPTSPEVGHKAPNISLKTLDGKTISLSQLRGKRVFVNFWASWCDPCKRETPGIVAMSKLYGNKVTFIGVNLTSGDSIGDVKKFVQQFKIPYPILVDVNGISAHDYELASIPTSVFINQKGIIIEKQPGAFKTEQQMNDMFRKLVRQ